MISESGSPRKKNRIRPGRLILVAILIAVIGSGGYLFYGYRKKQNTLKLLAQGREAVQAENWDGAVAAYRQYLRRRPNDVPALEAYADSLLQQAKTQPASVGEAIRILQRITELQANHLSALSRLTGLYLGFREFTQARTYAEQWFRLAPESTEAILSLAQARFGAGETQAAADVLTTALEKNPDQPDFYPFLAGLLVHELHQVDEAQRWLTTALKTAPDSFKVQLAAYVFHQSRKDHKAARQHLDRALELSPDSVETLLSAAMFHRSADRLEQARSFLERAKRIDPENPAVLAMDVQLSVREGSASSLWATADDLWDRAEGKDVAAMAQATELYLRAGELDPTLRAKALERVQFCIEKLSASPRLTDRLESQAEALRGALALDEDRPYEAVARLVRVVQQQETVWTLHHLARAYWETGERETAAQTYQRLLVLAPQSAEIRLESAQLSWLRGRIDEVREAVASMPQDDPQQTRLVGLIKLACDLWEARQRNAIDPLSHDLSTRLELASSTAPTDASTVRWLMRCLASAGRRDKALALINDYLADKDHANPVLAVELGRLLLDKRDATQAMTLADRLIQRFSRTAEGYRLKINVLAAQNRYDEAVALVKDVPLPSDAQASLQAALADHLLTDGRTQAATAAFRTSASLSPDDLSILTRLARATTDRREALQTCERIRQIEGRTGLLWRFETAAALLNPRFRSASPPDSIDRARSLLEEGLSMRRHWPAAHLLLGQAHELAGQPTEALEAYQAALGQQPGLRTQPASIPIIQLLTRLNRLEEADRLLSALAAALPDHPDVLRLQVDQQVRRTDFKAAADLAERLLQLRPNDDAWAARTADLQRSAGRLERAETLARQALAGSPGSLPLLQSLVQTLIVRGQAAEAEAVVQEAMRTASSSAPLYLLHALTLHAQGRSDQTEAAMAEAQQLAPDDPGIWSASAAFWATVGRRDRQIQCEETAVELRGDDPARSLNLARLLAAGQSQEQRDRARAIINRRLQQNPDDAPAILLQTQLDLSAIDPDFEAVEPSVRRALSLDPQLPQAHRLLAMVQLQREQAEAALETAGQGLALNPNDIDLLLLSAEIHCLHLGQCERAVTPLVRLLELKPRLPRALSLLADAYRKTDQLDLLIQQIDRQAAGQPLTEPEIVLLATAFEQKGDPDRADSLYREAVDVAPDANALFLEYLRFKARSGQFEAVVSLVEERVKTAPQDVESTAAAAQMLCGHAQDAVWRKRGFDRLERIIQDHPDQAADAAYRRAMCHYQHEEWDDAEQQFRRAHALAPAEPNPVNGLAWMWCTNLDRCDEAVALIEKFVENGGVESIELLDTHGTVLLNLQRFTEAATVLEQCRRLAGPTRTFTAATYHLGLAYWRNGRRLEGETHVRRALILDRARGGLTEAEREYARTILALE